ncbi:MAG: hypothetical protein IKA75_10845 [Bacteroidaceae bacterium]|nr:hypothetical protein [Bacteroidaceae bacterium]
MNFLKRTYIWCRRFRHRRGYGVHSPFAFGLITDVVYERLPYYAYDELKEVRRSLPKGARIYPERVDRLLFRLVNHLCPQRVVEVGTGAGLSLCYLATGRANTQCVSLPGDDASDVMYEMVDRCKNASVVEGPLMETLQHELQIVSGSTFLHIAHTEDFSLVFEKFLSNGGEKMCVVIEGIYDTRAKNEWWEQVVADERTGITFDLYEVGIVFFDHTKNKQHYVVNF